MFKIPDVIDISFLQNIKGIQKLPRITNEEIVNAGRKIDMDQKTKELKIKKKYGFK